MIYRKESKNRKNIQLAPGVKKISDRCEIFILRSCSYFSFSTVKMSKLRQANDSQSHPICSTCSSNISLLFFFETEREKGRERDLARRCDARLVSYDCTSLKQRSYRVWHNRVNVYFARVLSNCYILRIRAGWLYVVSRYHVAPELCNRHKYFLR